MIPKIIHYCWFGGEKPRKIQECIQSWHEHLPDYTFMEWNVDNFDVNMNSYVQDAYQAKKYAFVSDVARVKALSEMGGIYLDTDVVVYQNFDKILAHRCVLGFEQDNYVATSFMACEPGHPLMRQFFQMYETLPFYDQDGKIISGTNVSKLTNMLLKKGLQRDNKYQLLEAGIAVYPQEYFSPYEYGYCINNRNENTICEHLFLVSWMPWTTKIKKQLKRMAVGLIGPKHYKRMRNGIKG